MEEFSGEKAAMRTPHPELFGSRSDMQIASLVKCVCVCIENHDPNALRQWLQWPLVLIVIFRYCVLIPFLSELKII